MKLKNSSAKAATFPSTRNSKTRKVSDLFNLQHTIRESVWIRWIFKFGQMKDDVAIIDVRAD